MITRPRSLSSFEFPSDKSKAKQQIQGVLDCVLRLKENKEPCYSLGIVKLFQNTALYLSAKKGSSLLITSPCSMGSISYLGFQDGILLERTKYTENVLDYLFGLQFLYRVGAKEYHELPHLQKVKYYPNYLDAEGMIKALKDFPDAVFTGQNRIDQNKIENFGDYFRQYVQSPHVLFPELYNVIKLIEDQQLSLPLISSRKLKERVGEEWFEPDDTIDLSGDIMFDKFSNRISDDRFVEAIRPDPGEILLPVSRLIDHLRCFSYRHIRKLNLSKNYICTEGACEIALALSNNILPDLEELDLSINQINDNGVLKKFEPLLKRSNFKYLSVHSNRLEVETIDTLFSNNRLLLKVIWIPKAWLEELWQQKKILKDHYEAHKSFYKFP